MYSSLIIVFFLLASVQAGLRPGLNGRILIVPDSIEAIISEEHSRQMVEVRFLIEEEIDVATSRQPMRDALKASCGEHTAFYKGVRRPKRIAAAIPIVIVGVVAVSSLAASVYSVSQSNQLAKITGDVEREVSELRMQLGNVSSDVHALERRMEAMRLSAIRSSIMIDQFTQLVYHGRTPKSLLRGSQPLLRLKKHAGVKFTDTMLLDSTATLTDCDTEAGAYVTIRLEYHGIIERYNMFSIVDIGSMVNDVYTYYPEIHEVMVIDGKAVKLNMPMCRRDGKFLICGNGETKEVDCDYDVMRGSDCGRLNVEKKVEPFVRFITGSVAVVGSPYTTVYNHTDSLGDTKTVELPAGTIHLVRSSGRGESLTIKGEDYPIEAPDMIVTIPVTPMVTITMEENMVYQQEKKRDLYIEQIVQEVHKAQEKKIEGGLKKINESGLNRFADQIMEKVKDSVVYIALTAACGVGMVVLYFCGAPLLAYLGCSKCLRCIRCKRKALVPDPDDNFDHIKISPQPPPQIV